VKYRLLDPSSGQVHATGLIERVTDHGAALDEVLDRLGDLVDDATAPRVVGHRVVHGGTRFVQPTVVDDDVLAAIDELAVLAPLHNPANLAGIRAARDRLPDVPHVAVFDTAFHATMPPAASTYAVPRSWREQHGVRRYGFHGTSHAYVSRRVAAFLDRPLEELATVVLHLGNGASACAVQGGRSIDTSMGLTPVAGLVMGTRSGDIDPAVPAHLARVADLSPAQVDDALNHASGLVGLAGVGDMRDVTQRVRDGDHDAILALEVYCHRVRGYVGAYIAALGRLDSVAFTAGVGENSPIVRERCLSGLEGLGIVVDDTRNRSSATGERRISPDASPVAVLVVPTDEEREIASQALAALG
jgi:acetate kinase